MKGKYLMFSAVLILTYGLAIEALKCYTGLKLVGGQVFGSDETMECEDDSDYCYNATAKGGILLNVAKAGCSTYRCLLARDKCIGTDIQGIPVNFCCCSTSLCNGREVEDENK